jgi:hypothetical protein
MAVGQVFNELLESSDTSCLLLKKIGLVVVISMRCVLASSGVRASSQLLLCSAMLWHNHRWGGAGPPPAMYAPMALPHAMGPPEMLPSWAAPGHQSGAQVQGKPVSAGPYRAPAHPYAPADLAASHPGPQHLQRSNSDRMYAPGPGQQMPWAPAPHVPPQQPGLFPGNAYGHVSGPMMPPGLQQAPVYPASHQPLQAHSPPPYQQPAWHQGLTAAYSPGAGPSTGNMRPPYGMHQQGYGQAPPVGGPEFGSRRLQGPGVQPWAQHQQPGDYAGGSGSGGGGVPEWARLNAGQYYSTGWSAAPHEAAAGPLSGFADVLRHRAMQQQQQHGYAGPPGEPRRQGLSLHWAVMLAAPVTVAEHCLTTYG